MIKLHLFGEASRYLAIKELQEAYGQLAAGDSAGVDLLEGMDGTLRSVCLLLLA